MSRMQHVEMLLLACVWVFTAAASYLLLGNDKSSKIPKWSDKPQVVAPSPERNITRLTAPNCDPFAIAIDVKHG